MSLSSNVNSLATRIATEFNAVRAEFANAGASIAISETAPTNANIWFNSTNGEIYVYYDSTWVGVSGNTGESAYEVAVRNGYSGTEIQWLASLVGPAGPGVPTGGTTGQYLTKVNGTNYNTQWSTLDLSSYATKTGGETLTNKTLALGSNTVSGTTAQFNTALTDGDFTTQAGYEQLTNKTIMPSNQLRGAYSPWFAFDTAQGAGIGPADASNSFLYTYGSTPGCEITLTAVTTVGHNYTIANIASVPVTIKNYNSTVTINVIQPGQTFNYNWVDTRTGTGITAGWLVRQVAFSDGYLNVNQTATTDTDPVVIQSKNGHGGTGFAGLLTLKNTTSGATNPHKFFRMTSNGTLEIIDSGYTKTIFSLTDAGVLNVNGAQLDNNAWTSYTPSLRTESGTWTVGNGSISAKYKTIGKTCFFRMKVVVGSTTAIGAGALVFGLPVTAASADYQFAGSMLDNGNAWYQVTGNGNYLNSTTEFACIVYSGSGRSSQGVGNNVPFNFLDGDYITISGSYECA